MNSRTQRAKQMMEMPDCAVQFSPEKFSVRSQSIPQIHYIISNTENGLVCDCPDHIKRQSDCKHIKVALELIRKNQGDTQEFRMMDRSNFRLCKFCDSGNIVKAGLKKNKNSTMQRFKCQDCKKRFTTNFGFEKMRYDPVLITRSLQMYFSGMSVRDISDARRIIASGKKLISNNPNYVLTDSLNSYQEAIRKEFENRTAHVRTKSLKDGFVNRPIERYHNEIRENTKTRHGLGNDESAQDFAELLKINHNFVKSHQGLKGKTPAQAANVDLGLGADKYLDLIKQAGNKPNFVNNLGKRIKKVTIVNEGDSIKISPKGWIDKSVWREINDILKLHKFSWLSNGKDSCWMKLLS